MSEALVTLCRAHEMLRQKEHDTREERADLRSAKAALSEMALDSMQRHGVECIPLPNAFGAEGRPLYARVSYPTPRHKPFTCEDDAIALVRETSFDASSVPHDARADVLVRMIKARATAAAASGGAGAPAAAAASLPAGAPAGAPLPAGASLPAGAPAAGALLPAAVTPHITLVTSQPRNGVVSTAAPAETRELLMQYATACKDMRESTRALKPYRDRKKTAEASVLTSLTEPVAIKVRNGEAEHTLRVVRKERVRKPSLGMRSFLALVREAVEVVNDAVATEDFDRALEHEVRVRVRKALAPPAPTPVVRVLGHGGRPPRPK